MGFTLIELMITMAIIGIIAAFAYPIYQDQAEKGRLSDGRVALTAAAQTMERCFSTTGSYQNCWPTGGKSSESGFYTVKTTSATDNTFVLEADRVKATGQNKCATLTLSNTGKQDISGTPTWSLDRCW
ncbi:MAG: type IV pilin protein [Alcanivorax sp.]|nr:type IV pilin protein [Alcanivorax sp.]